MHAEDIAANQAMGRHGATLMPSEGGVLTHCNAGALATAGYGTALGVIRAAVEQGKKIHVYADETRPFLQGSRLTAWELMKDGIPTTVISDNMAGAMMKQGKIGAIIVGADRIAANGDVANKIGTYTVAISPKNTASRSTWLRPFPPSTWRAPTAARFPSSSATRGKSPTSRKADGPGRRRHRKPAFDVTQRNTWPPSSLSAALSALRICRLR
jgi:methylthioribose-1-phosphate isomerase